VISRLTNDKPIKATRPHTDLLMAARELMASCGYKIELMFVQGHQDDGKPTALSREAWLNIKADLITKQKALTQHMGPICYTLPGNPWWCYVDNQHIVKQFDLKIWQPSIEERQWITGATKRNYQQLY